MLLLCSCFTAYVFTIRDLTVISSFMSDLSFKFDRCTLTAMCCNSDLTIWWIFYIITLTHVWFNELCFSWMFSLIWFIKLSLTVRLFSFFSILESCFWQWSYCILWLITKYNTELNISLQSLCYVLFMWLAELLLALII